MADRDAVILAYGIYSYIKCRKMVQKAVLLISARQTEGSIRRKVKIWECDRIPSPFVLGIFRPQIYIPFRMEKKEQQYILAHESWHIRRYDPLWKWWHLCFLPYTGGIRLPGLLFLYDKRHGDELR